MHEGNGDSIPSTTVPDRINCLWKRTDPGWGHTWKELRKKKKVKTAGHGGPSCNVNILGDAGKRIPEFKDDLGYTPKAYLKSK